MKISGTERSVTDAPCDRTRDAVARAVLERGPQSAAALAERLGLSPAAIRRHLDALVADGLLAECEPRRSARRGRGRPARSYALTESGRAAFPHAYDDLASTALRYLRETGGEQAVDAFARRRAEELAGALAVGIDPAAPIARRTEALAQQLSEQGYASTTQDVALPATGTAHPGSRHDRSVPSTQTAGIQICQHHCPVAHVAAEFPQLCEAETRAFEQVLGTYVQRLATIAHGDGVCTTHVPVAARHAPSPTPAGRTR